MITRTWARRGRRGWPRGGDTRFRFPPVAADDEVVLLQAEEGAERADDVIAPCPGGANLCPLAAAVLLEAVVIHLDAAGQLAILLAVARTHTRVTRRPIFRVPVREGQPEGHDDAGERTSRWQ